MTGLLQRLTRRRGADGRVVWQPRPQEVQEEVKLEADGESLLRMARLWPGLRALPVPDSGGRQWQVEIDDLPGLFLDESGEYRVRHHQRFELRMPPGYNRWGFRFFSLLPLAGPHVTVNGDREVCLTGDLRFLKASDTLAARVVPILANVVSLRAVNPDDVHDMDVWYWMKDNGIRGPLVKRDYQAEMEPLLDSALADLERWLGWRDR